MQILPKKLPENFKRILRPALVIFGVISVFLILNSFTLSSRISNETQSQFFSVGSGVQKIYKKVFASKTEIIEESNHYKFLAANRTINEAKLFDLEQQVKELEKQLEYKQSVQHASISAKILARSVVSESSILIDKGSEEGMREGLPVVVGDGYIVGTIQSVKPHRSTVLLLRDSASSIPSAALSGQKVVGLVSGLNSFLLFMDFIPQSENIQEQEIIITSGLDRDIPAGLIIGVIDNIVENETAPFKQAYVDPVIDFNDYTSVLILDPLATPNAQ